MPTEERSRGRVDLDELEAFYSSIDFDRSPQVVAVIAELRAAREVVEGAALFLQALDDPEPLAHWTERRQRLLAESVAAYDQAVAS